MKFLTNLEKMKIKNHSDLIEKVEKHSINLDKDMIIKLFLINGSIRKSNCT